MANKSKGFQFKQFFIEHSQCAMKVNTDSILFATAVDIAHCENMLDLGTGSGLIAIILAQRTACNVKITGVELDTLAFLQAQHNVKNSPWANKIQLFQADIMQCNFTQKFDLIVSNPPYFEHSLVSSTAQRSLARNAIQSHISWLSQAKNWLTENGKISFILPFNAGNLLIEKAKTLDLYCIEKWQILTKAGKSPKRVIVTFSLNPKEMIEKRIEIYQQDNQYTPEFKALTQDFYLNF